MYEAFFELKRRPFPSTPDPGRYFRTPELEEALAQLKCCVHHDEGIGVLVGPAGTGKTLACRLLMDYFEPSFPQMLVTNTHAPSVRSLLQALLYDLSLPYVGLEEQELRLALTDHLVEQLRHGGRVLLFIDEAHLLSADQLEELRLLTNLESATAHALQVLLFAQEPLIEKLSATALAGVRQRIATVSRLAVFTAEQTVEYVSAQIAAAGGVADTIFTAGSLSEICELSGGIPRRINQLCHRAMLHAFALQSGTVDSPHVQAAAEPLAWLRSQADLCPHHSAAALQPGIREREKPSARSAPAHPSVVEVGADIDRMSVGETASPKPAELGKSRIDRGNDVGLPKPNPSRLYQLFAHPSDAVGSSAAAARRPQLPPRAGTERCA
jgi:type II secretory pathway predicted ATPase ExeA